ncbi:hypothetical protein Ocin01_19653 [Orchesella cincta]|uniref:Uncharacterized protein n=1 Tax=Orchesella cincta TaxID=48709 RepID=A0A1D2M233_ORCCI|nr:hypothetical protein Ocin01_19653 [Orchesella cincta]
MMGAAKLKKIGMSKNPMASRRRISNGTENLGFELDEKDRLPPLSDTSYGSTKQNQKKVSL